MNKNKELTESWNKGFKAGEESVLKYLTEMYGKILNVDTIKEDYKNWSICDEYTNCKGELVKRYE